MKVYSMKQKYLMKRSATLPKSEEGVIANTVQGNPKSNMENFHKSVGGTLLNSLTFSETPKKKQKARILNLSFRNTFINIFFFLNIINEYLR
jgi:hypothetical protein